jgi:hypothetical protein
MVIRFTSTLTADDEARIAPALLKALGNLLAPFPISYSIRIETTEGDIVEDGRTAPRSDARSSSGSHSSRDLNDRRSPFDITR